MEINLKLIIPMLLVSHAYGRLDFAKQLFEDLLSGYNKLIRPVANDSDLLKVRFKLSLTQLLDVHEKNQIMTTNVWLQHEWHDYKLQWRPEEYGNVSVLYVPGQMIWRPDIVLYNKFPFDAQTCQLKFGSWTYDGFQVDLLHMERNESEIVRFSKQRVIIECIENGIDLSGYYPSTEWDILAVPGRKKREVYPCCPTPYIDITYDIHLRRKTFFYTVNLILPCIGISFLTLLVFYLPSDSGEKVTLSISILLCLTVFFLLLVEIIPSTSLVIPLIGKYLLFTMVLVTFSICITVVAINFHFRSPRTHQMSAWMRKWFLHILPCFLFMSRPKPRSQRRLRNRRNEGNKRHGLNLHDFTDGFDPLENFMDASTVLVNHIFFNSANAKAEKEVEPLLVREKAPTIINQLDKSLQDLESHSLLRLSPGAQKALEGVNFIADSMKAEHDDWKIMEDWKFVAMVIDRLFLVLFSLACFIGTTTIILQAPTLYDTRQPIYAPTPQIFPQQINTPVEKYCNYPSE